MERGGMFQDIEDSFVEDLALIILEAGFSMSTEFRRGWLSGYARAWTKLTGKSVYVLVERANKAIEGSGHVLKVA